MPRWSSELSDPRDEPSEDPGSDGGSGGEGLSPADVGVRYYSGVEEVSAMVRGPEGYREVVDGESDYAEAGLEAAYNDAEQGTNHKVYGATSPGVGDMSSDVEHGSSSLAMRDGAANVVDSNTVGVGGDSTYGNVVNMYAGHVNYNADNEAGVSSLVNVGSSSMEAEQYTGIDNVAPLGSQDAVASSVAE